MKTCCSAVAWLFIFSIYSNSSIGDEILREVVNWNGFPENALATSIDSSGFNEVNGLDLFQHFVHNYTRSQDLKDLGFIMAVRGGGLHLVSFPERQVSLESFINRISDGVNGKAFASAATVAVLVNPNSTGDLDNKSLEKIQFFEDEFEWFGVRDVKLSDFLEFLSAKYANFGIEFKIIDQNKIPDDLVSLEGVGKRKDVFYVLEFLFGLRFKFLQDENTIQVDVR